MEYELSTDLCPLALVAKKLPSWGFAVKWQGCQTQLHCSCNLSELLSYGGHGTDDCRSVHAEAFWPSAPIKTQNGLTSNFMG